MVRKSTTSRMIYTVISPIWIFLFLPSFLSALFNQHQVLELKTNSAVIPTTVATPSLVPIRPDDKQTLSGVHVKNNHLENDSNQPIRLFGVNRSGTEYSCITGAFSDGPTDLSSILAIKSWNINTIRIPLNQDCWLNQNGVKLGGLNYKNKLLTFVRTITQQDMLVILDLHWNAPRGERATGQQPMPDSQSIDFWTSVANTFKNNDHVMFDLFNEPNPIEYRANYPGGFDTWQKDAFACTLLGCNVTSSKGTHYKGVGLQKLLTTVRDTGATNVVLISGIQSSGTITQYTGNKKTKTSGYMPVDPLHNIAVSMHMYDHSACSDTYCWNKTVLPVSMVYPIVATEFGDTNCTADYTKVLLPWLDHYQISYVGWTWDTWNSCEALITSYSGSPTLPYGLEYKTHLQEH